MPVTRLRPQLDQGVDSACVVRNSVGVSTQNNAASKPKGSLEYPLSLFNRNSTVKERKKGPLSDSGSTSLNSTLNDCTNPEACNAQQPTCKWLIYSSND